MYQARNPPFCACACGRSAGASMLAMTFPPDAPGWTGSFAATLTRRRGQGDGRDQPAALVSRTHSDQVSILRQNSSRVPAKLCMWLIRGQT